MRKRFVGETGNTLLIVLFLAVVAAGVYFLVNKGKDIRNPVVSDYTLNSTSSSESETSPEAALSTSDKISISITSPLNGVVLGANTVTIKGKTSPNAEVFVNDSATKADANGEFTLTINVDEGENSLIITANDEEGNVAEQTLLVNVKTF